MITITSLSLENSQIYTFRCEAHFSFQMKIAAEVGIQLKLYNHILETLSSNKTVLVAGYFEDP